MFARQRAAFLTFCRLAIVLELFGSSTLAQAPAVEPAGYRPLIDAGLAEYDANNFLEARALFAKAHALYPNARTLRVLGMTEFELRHYPQCLDYLKQALASTVHPLDPALRAQTEELRDRTLEFVGRVHLALQPAETQVRVDGLLVPLPPDGLVLQVGEHVLTLSAQNFRSEERRLDIAGGEEQTLQLALAPDVVEPQPLPAAAPADAVKASTPLYASPWLWAGVGVVLAGVAVGLIVALQPGTRTEIGAPVKTGQTPPGASLQTLVRAGGGS